MKKEKKKIDFTNSFIDSESKQIASKKCNDCSKETRYSPLHGIVNIKKISEVKDEHRIS